MPTLDISRFCVLGKTLQANMQTIAVVQPADKSAGWQPQSFRLLVRFLNWAMRRCILEKDGFVNTFHNGVKHLPV